jgi:hypothetical protein
MDKTPPWPAAWAVRENICMIFGAVRTPCPIAAKRRPPVERVQNLNAC